MSSPPPVTLAEFKAEVNIPPATTTQDDELTMTLEAATEAVEGWNGIGPMVQRSVTERVKADSGFLLLTQTPAISITSVTKVGANDGLGPDEVDLDGVAGIVCALSGWLHGSYTVVYEAGRDPVPTSLAKATLIIGAHLWKTQRGPRTRLRGEDEESRAQWTGAGYLIPNQAAHLMKPHASVPVG